MVSQQKKKIVQQLVSDIENYAIVGVVNLQHLPARTAGMRSMLKERRQAGMTRKSYCASL